MSQLWRRNGLPRAEKSRVLPFLSLLPHLHARSIDCTRDDPCGSRGFDLVGTTPSRIPSPPSVGLRGETRHVRIWTVLHSGGRDAPRIGLSCAGPPGAPSALQQPLPPHPPSRHPP